MTNVIPCDMLATVVANGVCLTNKDTNYAPISIVRLAHVNYERIKAYRVPTPPKYYFWGITYD